VIKGDISLGGGEYRVRRSRGEMFVPEGMVQFVCRDLRDAYQKQKDSLREFSAADHVALSRWCLGYNLLEEAREELRGALALEPGRIQARRMLERLDNVLGHSESSTEAGKSRSAHQVAGQAAESLGGLTEEDARVFARRIQPILMNNCSNARCHGSAAENDFQIVHAKLGGASSRYAAERNLAAVLKYVDFEKPYQSQFLTVLKGAHGGANSALHSRKARLQSRQLQEWVLSISEEKTNRSLAKQTLKRQLNSQLNSTTANENGRKIKLTPFDQELSKHQPDPFDPSGFNARNALRR